MKTKFGAVADLSLTKALQPLSLDCFELGSKTGLLNLGSAKGRILLAKIGQTLLGSASATCEAAHASAIECICGRNTDALLTYIAAAVCSSKCRPEGIATGATGPSNCSIDQEHGIVQPTSSLAVVQPLGLCGKCQLLHHATVCISKVCSLMYLWLETCCRALIENTI